LQNNDILTYTTTDYTGYHLTNSTLCSPIGVINCNADNSISIITANNADQILRLTKFNFIIKNSPFVGLSTFIVTVYDDTKLYIKQNSTFFINVQ
jgi:hypothetical protein